MKKLFTLLTLMGGFLCSIAETPVQQGRIPASGMKRVSHRNVIHPNLTSNNAMVLDTNSRWFNYGETMDLIQNGNSVANFNYLFPDSTILADFGGTLGSPFVHNMGNVLDLSSAKFYDPTYYAPDSNMHYAATQQYKVDSIEYLFSYTKNLPTVTDTLIFEVAVNMSATQLPTYYFTGMAADFGYDTVRFKALRYAYQTNAFGNVGNANKRTYKIALTDSIIADTLENGLNHVKFPCIGLPTMNAGSKYAISNVRFKPGYTWIPNVDTLANKNELLFVSYEEVDNGFPTYTPNDYNISQIAITDVRYNLDPNWNGFYIPSVAYTAPFAFEHHLIYYKIRRAAACATAIAPSVVSTVNATCNQANGSAVLSATGGSTGTYNFLLGGINYTNPTISNLGPGTYNVVVADGQNCQSTLSVTIANTGTPSTLTSSAQPSTQCNAADGQATVTATGGAPFSYLWNTGDTTASITRAPGVYTVTVTNSFGCIATRTVTIVPGGLPTITSSVTNVACNGQNTGAASVNYQGTATPTYQWYIGPGVGSQLPSQTASTLTNRVAGSYTCIVMDSNLCKDTIEVTITQPNLLTGSVSTTPQNSVNPPDGTASVTAGGGTAPYSFVWSNGFSGTSNPSQNTQLTNGSYSVVITDANGCTLSRTVSVLTTGINTLGADSYNAKVYPNPAGNVVNVEFSSSKGENLNLRLVNMNGQEMLSQSMVPSRGRNVTTLDVSSLPRGAYFLQIVGENGTSVRKIIKL